MRFLPYAWDSVEVTVCRRRSMWSCHYRLKGQTAAVTNREGQHIEVRAFQSDWYALKEFSGPVIEHPAGFRVAV